MTEYKRLTFLEREEISREVAAGSSLREVAQALQRSPSTITREINRSVVDRKFYRAFFAQGRSNKILHQRHKNRKLDNNPELRKVVLNY